MEIVHCGSNYHHKDNNFSIANVPNGNLVISYDDKNFLYTLSRLDGKVFDGTERVGGIYICGSKKLKNIDEIIDFEIEFIKSIQRLDNNFKYYVWSYNDNKTSIIIKPITINKELVEYLDNNIIPCYLNNDSGHNIDHIMYVIDRSMRFAKDIPDINYDMVYTIATYHDIGHFIDAKSHEKISGQILFHDIMLRSFFTLEEIKIMQEAVVDHRASMKEEPRSIYGKIVSSADRNTIVNVTLKRTFEYRLKNNPEMPIDELIEDSRQHILKKFGNHGYAIDKIYFEDLDYSRFLNEITNLAKNVDEFRKKYCSINNLDLNQVIRKMER